MDRLEQGDKMLLLATKQFERDPNGTLSIARSAALAQIATALYLREMLDRGSVEVDLDGPAEDTPPW